MTIDYDDNQGKQGVWCDVLQEVKEADNLNNDTKHL